MKSKLLERIVHMSTEDIYDELYRDHLTGALNRKALGVDDKPYCALIDLDSLKYVNDSLGHRWGDRQLKVLADALITIFDDQTVYRVSGDEFVVKGKSPTLLNAALQNLAKRLPTFSYGIGESLDAADTQLRVSKSQREMAGQRAERGERPPWLKEFKLPAASGED